MKRSLVVASIALLGACTSSVSTCVPGQSQACAGPGGCAGYQTCAEDGTSLPCDCVLSDAGRPEDAGPVPDAGGLISDAGTDAGTENDEDSDGVAASRDCDDSDPGVGASASRACTTVCGAGSEVCVDGIWATCDAPTSCLCAEPESTQIIACGFCGMQAQRCSAAGLWEDVGACLNQGDCGPGGVETRSTDLCGEEQRLCNTACTWGPWNLTVANGECVADVSWRRCDSLAIIQFCQDDCTWPYCEGK